MKSPRPDGLSSQEEADTLWKLEDNLTTTLEKELNAVFVGRITSQGRREFYFHAPQAPENDGVIDRSLSSFSRCEYKTGTQDDPSWHQYLSVLYPPEEEVQKIENRRVLEVLQKKGDRAANLKRYRTGFILRVKLTDSNFLTQRRSWATNSYLLPEWMSKSHGYMASRLEGETAWTKNQSTMLCWRFFASRRLSMANMTVGKPS